MTNPMTVNELFARRPDVEAQPVEVEGILIADDSGGFELRHYPRLEQVSQFIEPEYRAAVWLSFGNGSLQPNHAALHRWSGKRVRVHGIIRSIVACPAPHTPFDAGVGP